MNGVECAALPDEFPGEWDEDRPWVWPDEFVNEPAPVLWLDDSLDIGVRVLEAEPGPVLAAALDDADGARLDDPGLLTAIAAWRRLASWAMAGEAAMVAAFMNRRVAGGGGIRAWESAAAEVQAELTLSRYGVERLVELAGPLAELLPGTRDALRRGVIDETKARVIARAVDGVLDAVAARRVEESVLPAAPGQTTGQLRHAVERAVIEADPGAAERRRVQAEAGRRVEVRPTDAYTADLCGRDLPAARALAADNRITALARALKTDGAPEPMAALRAEVFVNLLLGTGPVPAWPPPGHASSPGTPFGCDGPGPAGGQHIPGRNAGHRDRGLPGEKVVSDRSGGPRAGADTGSRDHEARAPAPSRAGSGGGFVGTVHVIVPIATLTGHGDHPGVVPGFGPVPASVARSIAATATRSRRLYTLIDQTGRPLRHGHLPPGEHRDLPAAITASVAAEVARGDQGLRGCRFQNADPDDAGPKLRHLKGTYRPPDSLRRQIEARDGTCRFPACRRPASQCDIDHTIPYDDGGVTCVCNLAPLCRAHHRLKQSPGWTLTQPEPGRLIWTTPSRRTYRSAPFPYAWARDQ